MLSAPRLVSVSLRSKQYSHCASAVALPSAVYGGAVGSVCRVDRRRHLARDDRHRGVLVAGNDRLDAQEQRLVLVGVEVLEQRVLELLERLPAPHVPVRAGARHVALRNDAGGLPPGVRSLGPRRTDRRAWPASRPRPACSCGCRCRRVRPARTSRGPTAFHLVHRLLDQLLHRDRAVRAGACGCGSRRPRRCRASSARRSR